MSASRPLTRAERGSVEEIRHALSSVEEHAGCDVFAAVMPGLRALLGMEQSALFLFEKSDESVGVERLFIDGSSLPGSDVRRIADAHFRSTRVWALYDPRDPEAEQQNVPMIVGGTLAQLEERGTRGQLGRASSRLGIDSAELEHRLDAFEETERRLLAPIGWDGRKQLRTLLCDGSGLLAWLGGTSDAFGAREQHLLGVLGPVFLARIRLEKRLQEGAMGVLGLITALEAIGSPAFVVSSSGAVQHANALGRTALTSTPDLATKLREVAHGREPPNDMEVSFFSSAGVPPHVLVVVRSPERDLARRLNVATARWDLTSREVAVLRKLIGGAANKDIAAALDCSLRTVEVHITHLLAKTARSSRLELIALFWTIP